MRPQEVFLRHFLRFFLFLLSKIYIFSSHSFTTSIPLIPAFLSFYPLLFYLSFPSIIYLVVFLLFCFSSILGAFLRVLSFLSSILRILSFLSSILPFLHLSCPPSFFSSVLSSVLSLLPRFYLKIRINDS